MVEQKKLKRHKFRAWTKKNLFAVALFYLFNPSAANQYNACVWMIF